MDISHWLAQVHQGNDAARERVFQHSRALAFGWLVSWLENTHHAARLATEVARHAVDDLAEAAPSEPFEPWLARRAWQACQPGLWLRGWWWARTAKATDPLGSALSALPNAQRIPVLLRHQHGFTLAEIAFILGHKEAQVRQRIHQGRLRLWHQFTPPAP